MIYMRPSNIGYIQDSISNVFRDNSDHANVRIGKTLDDLLQGLCKVSDIEPITVIKKNGHWFSVDNRRLWVFKKFEELGGCTEILVKIGTYCPPYKDKTLNNGRSIRIRGGGDPGGRYWKQYQRPANNNTTSHQSLTSMNSVSTRDSPSSSHSSHELKATPRRTTERNISPAEVYYAFDEYWTIEGNGRLWLFKRTRPSVPRLKIPAVVKADEEKFIEKIRENRPWLSLLDIIQMADIQDFQE